MLMIKAIVRPERSGAIMEALFAAGFPAITRMDVSGRGKQKGIQLGTVVYDELPKDMLYIACEDENKDIIIKTIMEAGRTGDGEHGDGRIFVSRIEEAYTIRTGESGL